MVKQLTLYTYRLTEAAVGCLVVQAVQVGILMFDHHWSVESEPAVVAESLFVDQHPVHN